MIIDRTLSARIKVQRAYKHIRDLQAEIDTFNSYELVEDFDPKTGELGAIRAA